MFPVLQGSPELDEGKSRKGKGEIGKWMEEALDSLSQQMFFWALTMCRELF